MQHCINRADFEEKFFGDASVEEIESRPSESNEKDTNAGLGMIDSFRHLHPQQKGYTFYPRLQGGAKFGDSCDRVDMILLSRTLRDSLVSAGMHETSADRGTSDHVPLYATLQFPQHMDDVDDSAKTVLIERDTDE
jgi:exonuclease III